MKFKTSLSLIAIIFFFSACNNSGDSSTTDLNVENFEVPDSLFNDVPVEEDQEAMGEIISNISSPVEMSALLKDEGIEFNYKFLSSTDDIDEYNTSFKQALNLGVLGADMGYLNMYNKTGAVINYITAIKELSDELKVGQFFNFETLKRLATNSENIDSLMYMSISAFDNMDAYLVENHRSSISSLLVTGVWVEGLYLATQVVKENDNQTIRERVAEQKIVLEQLLIVLSHYKNDKKFFELNNQLETLNASLSKVNIIEHEGESEMIEVDGVLTVVSNTTTTIEMTDEQLEEIIANVENVRNFIIKY